MTQKSEDDHTEIVATIESGKKTPTQDATVQENEESWVDDLFRERKRIRETSLPDEESREPGLFSERIEEGDGGERVRRKEDDSQAENGTQESWSSRFSDELESVREHPTALLDLLPFAAFILFILISLVLGIYSYSLQQRVAALEESNAAMSTAINRLATAEPEQPAPVMTEHPPLDQQWVVDKVVEEVEPIRTEIDALSVNVLALQEKLRQGEQSKVASVVKTPEQPEIPETEEKPEEAMAEQSVDSTPLILTPRKTSADSVPSENWVINLVSLTSRDAIESLRTRYQREGVPVQLEITEINGKTYYRLQVTGLESREKAEAYAQSIKQKLGLKNIWITQSE